MLGKKNVGSKKKFRKKNWVKFFFWHGSFSWVELRLHTEFGKIWLRKCGRRFCFVVCAFEVLLLCKGN